MTLIRALAFGAIVCIASWAGFAIGARDVGLQQSISRDPVFLATTYPLAIVLSLLAAFATALIFVRVQRAPRSFALIGASQGIGPGLCTSGRIDIRAASRRHE